MAVFGMGVVVAPIVGPVLGGWITDNYSWRWVFYVNIPFGILSVLLSEAFLEDPPYLRAGHERRGGQVDYIGFGAMALWLATLQVILDRGQQDDWFNARWICWASAISFVSMIVFIVWEFRMEHPLVNLRVLGNRNFALGTLLITAVGVVLYSTTALLPLFLQGLMGYSALSSGMAVSPRGIGAILALMMVGRLVGKVDTRVLMTIGFSVLSYSCWQFACINTDIAIRNVIWPNVISGLAMGFVFVPVTTTCMANLPNEQMGNATGIFNLMRNIGGSFGISLATTLVARTTQAHQATMVGHLTPYDPQFQQYVRALTIALAHYGNPAIAGQQAYQAIGGDPHAAGRCLRLCRYVPRADVSLSALHSVGVAVSEDAAARRSRRASLADGLGHRRGRQRGRFQVLLHQVGQRGGRGRDTLGQTHLPAAGQRLVKRDQVDRHLPATLGNLVLLANQVALGVQHRFVIDQPFLVLEHRQGDGLVGGGCGGFQRLRGPARGGRRGWRSPPPRRPSGRYRDR